MNIRLVIIVHFLLLVFIEFFNVGTETHINMDLSFEAAGVHVISRSKDVQFRKDLIY